MLKQSVNSAEAEVDIAPYPKELLCILMHTNAFYVPHPVKMIINPGTNHL